MARVRLIPDEQMNRVVSRHQLVQRRLEVEMNRIAARAQGRLAGHHDTGATQIYALKLPGMKYGEIDYFVVMDDASEQSAANVIDQNLNILRAAAGII